LTTKLLMAGQQMTATQTYTGTDSNILAALGGNTESDPSTSSLPILKTPDPLPAPVFDSGLCTCMDWVQMGGLIPGATLTIKLQNPSAPLPLPTVVNAIVTQSVQWFQLASNPIDKDAVLEAHQSGLKSSPSGVTQSGPILVAPALGPPVISPEPMACETSLSFSNMQPGADLNIINGSNEWLDQTSPGPSFYLIPLAPPLQAKPSSAQQYFTRCKNPQTGENLTGPKKTFTVSAPDPKKPKVTYPLCQDVTQLMVSDVVSGEILTLTYSYTSTIKGPLSGQPLTAAAVSGRGPAPSPFPLPSKWYPPDSVPGSVTLQIVGWLCTFQSQSLSVPVVEPPRASGPPTVQQPLYDCATSVFVQDAQPGSLVQVCSGSAPPGTPISYPVVATTPNFPISLFSWSPLATGEHIFITQQGCNAYPNSSLVAVLPARPLMLPTVVGPYVLTDATSVFVNNVVPGAQVTLLLNGEPNSQVDSIQAETGPPSGTPPLIAVNVPVGGWPPLAMGDFLTAGQSLCQKSALPKPGQGGGVPVLKPVKHPEGGLNGSSNYFMYAPSTSATNPCQKLTGVSVTIEVQEDIVFDLVTPGTSGMCPGGTTIQGFGFQLNCYSLESDVPAFQQYVIALQGTELRGIINTFAFNSLGKVVPIITPTGEYQMNLVSGLGKVTIPKGYKMQIILGHDMSGNVNEVTWFVNGMSYPPSPLKIPDLLKSLGQPETDVAPIYAFTLDLVGPGCGEAVVLKSGAGLFTYSASSPLTVVNAKPGCAGPAGTLSGGGTQEHSNSSYGELPENPPNPFTQSFTVSGTTPH
jgi:hypothetical protein